MTVVVLSNRDYYYIHLFKNHTDKESDNSMYSCFHIATYYTLPPTVLDQNDVGSDNLVSVGGMLKNTERQQTPVLQQKQQQVRDRGIIIVNMKLPLEHSVEWLILLCHTSVSIPAYRPSPVVYGN